MHYRTHQIGLHYDDPEDEKCVFVNKFTGKNKSYSKQQIKAYEQARKLHASLAHPSVTDYKRVIQSNQIKGCPVTVK